MGEINGILIVDKPVGWTSHDVIAKLRGLLGTRRIGHAGTLDPNATGVLVVFVGRATRAVEFAEANEKEYVSGLRLGIKTDTQDIWGNVTEESSKKVSTEDLTEVLRHFIGDIEQIPPMYSAIKKDGKRLYELARKGVTIDREPRKIHISSLELEKYCQNHAQIRVRCSKGTYIRTLCNDIGEILGTGGVMDSLRRVRSGMFTINDAVTLEEIESTEDRSAFLRPVDTLFSNLPTLKLNSSLEARHRNGQKLAIDAKQGKYRVYSLTDGSFLSISQIKANGRGTSLEIIKSFYSVNC